jgi:hypothetical protein
MRQLVRAIGLAGALVAAGAAPASAQSSGGARSVVVVGVPTLQWSDVTESGTPALWALTGRGTVGSLSIRAAGPQTGRYDGWLTFGAGNRAAAPRGNAEPGEDLGAYIGAADRGNRERHFDGRVGAVGGALKSAGVRRVAFGKGAAVGLADSKGTVDEVHVPGASTELAAALHGELHSRTVFAIELDALLPVKDAAALRRLDAQVGDIVAAVPREDTLLVVGVSDAGGTASHLHVAIASGPSYGRGQLVSAMTRRDGFVQLIDTGPTVLDVMDVKAPDGVVGKPWRVAGRRADTQRAQIARMADADRAAQGYARYVQPFFMLLVFAQVFLYGFAWLWLRRRRSTADRTKAIALTRGAALAFAAVPASTYLAQLVPWWRHSLAVLVAVVAVIDLALYAVAVSGPWRHRPLGPEGVIGGITFTVIGIDLLTGARLQLSSPAGYSPIVAGRFAGIGNVAFAVYATGALVLACALCVGRSRTQCWGIVTVIGALAVVIDGSPLWGSDFGGVPALIAGFGVLVVLTTGGRLSWRLLVLLLGSAVGAVAAFALLDYARPADAQTHLGRFVAQVLHGGAGDVLARKARANLRLLTHSVLTLLLPIAVAFVTFVLLKPTGGLRRAFTRVPPLRAGLLAVLVMALVGAALNDSGIAVPALAITVAVPIALAASLDHLVSDDTPAAVPTAGDRVLP